LSRLFHKWHSGLRVLGVATAFASGEVIGETRKVLAEYGRLRPGNKLSYKIPFPIGMDTLLKFGPLTHDKVKDFIEANSPGFRSDVEKERESMYDQVKQYLKLKQFSARTFEEYGLRGRHLS
jgi:hypothetical protein